MKLYVRFVLAGGLLLALALTFAACGAATPETAPVVEEPTSAPTDVPPTEAPAAPVLEIISPSGTQSLTMDDLQAMPATEGYGGIKSSTGKITLPAKFKGVALKDLAALAGMGVAIGDTFNSINQSLP